MTGHHTPTHCHCGAHRHGSDHCPECGCEEYESYCDHEYEADDESASVNPEEDSMIRYAIVTNASSRSQAEAYLPDNYRIVWEGQVPAYEGADRTVLGFVIEGEDKYGWTLFDYVIPRYGSGLIFCHEIDSSHPTVKEIHEADCQREIANGWV